MALFKSKQDPPPADPPSGDPPPGDDKPPEYMTMDQFQEQIKPLQDTLGTVNESLKAMNANQQAYQQPTAPAAPAEDPNIELKDRVGQIDKQLEDLTKKAETVGYEGKGMADVMSQQNKLMIERSDLQGRMISGQVDPRMDAGIETLDALSTEITSGKMPNLAVPEVKERYDHYIGQLPIEQRMNPQAKIGAYNLAVGENLGILEEANKQKWLREAEEPPTQDPPPGGGHPPGASDGGPVTPEQVFSPEALRSIKGSRHRNAESYVRSLGYEGWDDYVEKNKGFLNEEEEE